MSSYLSRIEIVNGFNNIRPVMEMLDDGLIEVDEEKFGQYGTITIGSLYGTESPFIQDQKYCIFTISDSELASLGQTTSGYKIRAQDFLRHCKSVESSSIRELIVLPSTLTTTNYNTWGKNPISLMFMPFTKTVYLADEDSVLGPFSWEAVAGGQFHFVPCAGGNDPYLLKHYRKKDFDEPIYTFDAAKRQQDILFGVIRNAIKIDYLPEASDQVDCIDDNGLKDFVGRLLAQPLETKKEKREIKEAIISLPSLQISDERKNRILKLIKNGELADQAIGSIVSDVFRSNDSHAIELIVKKVLENANYSDQLLQIARGEESFRRILDILEKEKKTKEEELSKLITKIEAAKEIPDNGGGISNAEIKRLLDEKNELEQKLSEYKDFESVRSECDEAQKRIIDAQNQYQALTQLINGLKTQIEQTVRSAYADLAFDGAISSLMLQKAAQFERESNRKILSANVATVDVIKDHSLITDPADLVIFLHNELSQKANRSFSRDDIANLVICLSQGFLTMIAGDPGTGKTSLISLLSQMLGLTRPPYVRYTEIAVEKGWSSRRDLVGYYNPLTKSFDAANKGLFSALSTLNIEAEKGIADFPYFVLLDEANLSQMEHYWADFMSLCDLNKAGRKIALSEDYEFCIPETLRFIGTINLDHTTEPLSPRLIDRAWIIKLPITDLDIDDYFEPELDKIYPMVSYTAFHKLRDFHNLSEAKLDTAISEKFNRIRFIFQSIGIGFSPRTIGMIKHYCLAGSQLMDMGENNYVALDYAIAQKILPMIDGYGEIYQKFLEDLLKECDQTTMPKCYELLIGIQRKGSQNMQYYQFFAR